jgi:hypothetical protein
MTDTAALPSLFVVACPACGGWSAATAAMAGESACCPACAAAFRVPRPAAAPTQAPPVTAPAAARLPEAAAAPVEPAPAPAPRATESADPLPTFEVPDHGLAPAAPATDLQFHEPVKTVGRGPKAIELRRLTPEEKDARRRRRNIVMLLTGAAILIAIAVVLGTGRRRR